MNDGPDKVALAGACDAHEKTALAFEASINLWDEDVEKKRLNASEVPQQLSAVPLNSEAAVVVIEQVEEDE